MDIDYCIANLSRCPSKQLNSIVCQELLEVVINTAINISSDLEAFSLF